MIGIASRLKPLETAWRARLRRQTWPMFAVSPLRPIIATRRVRQVRYERMPSRRHLRWRVSGSWSQSPRTWGLSSVVSPRPSRALPGELIAKETTTTTTATTTPSGLRCSRDVTGCMGGTGAVLQRGAKLCEGHAEEVFSEEANWRGAAASAGVVLVGGSDGVFDGGSMVWTAVSLLQLQILVQRRSQVQGLASTIHHGHLRSPQDTARGSNG